MADLPHEATILVSEAGRLIDEIEDKRSEVSRLRSSRLGTTNGEDPTVFESRLRQTQNTLSTLIEDLRRVSGSLSEFKSRLANLSNRYDHDAGLYANTARQKDVAELPGARYQVQQAASYATHYKQENREHADEINRVLQRAQSIINQDFSLAHSGLSSSPANLDDLLGKTLDGLGNSPSSYLVDVSSCESFQPTVEFNVTSFPGYHPGTYSLYDSGKYCGEGHGSIRGMRWIK